MRIIRRMVAVGAVAATAATLALAAPAMADPVNSHLRPVTPAPYDIVGVGSESITYVTQALTFNYDRTISAKRHSPSHPYIYSWDAVPAFNLNDTTQHIILKAGCKRALRPNGSSAGITALTTYGNTHYTVIVGRPGHRHRKRVTVPCVDYARSSRPRGSSDPGFQKGGVAFVTMAQDAVTYASTAGSNVPSDLTRAQLTEIFGCTVPAANGFPANTWGALLGASAKGAADAIEPVLPQAGSGTLSFWAKTVLGIATTEPTCGPAAALTTPNQPEENEGTNPIFRIGDKSTGAPNPNVIYPFSIGAYVAQAYHDAACGKRPNKHQNLFGCNQNGILHLDSIDNPSGTSYGPPIVNKQTNHNWLTTPFKRFLYFVVRYATNTRDHIPANLEGFFGRKGNFCKQTKTLLAYGFQPTPLCGSTA